MQINIKATDIVLTPEIREYAEKKVFSLRKYIHTKHKGEREVSKAWVELGMETRHYRKGNIYRAEIQIKVPHIEGGLRAESVGETLFSAIDGAREQMKRKLARETSRKIEILRRGAKMMKKFVPRFNR